MTINKGIDEKLFISIKESLEKTPFYNLLGVEIVELAQGIAILKVDTRVEHTNPIGYIHGGLLMTIADAAMGNAIRSLGSSAVSIDVSTAFLSSARVGDEILATGQVLKSGRNLFFTEASLTVKDKLIAHCKGTFFKVGQAAK